jgi:putative nucleotidyltransferase with HDIG domain
MALLLLLGADKEESSGIRSLLRRDGHRVVWHRETADWSERERELRPDVVVAIVESAGEHLAGAGARAARGFPAPLLLLPREQDIPRELFHKDRLVDCLPIPFMSEELLGRVDALVRVRRLLQRPIHAGSEVGPSTGSQDGGLRAQLGNWLRQSLPRQEKPQAPYLEVAGRLAEWVDRRDAFATGHAERVALLCGKMAGALGLDEPETALLLRAAMLHDIGKIALPVEVLHQKQPLDEAQRRLIRTHPARGVAVLRALDSDEKLLHTVLYHHERPDGGGYYAKPGASIPVTARILAVAEVFDAMTSSLVRAPLAPQQALSMLEASRGKGYDADCVDALSHALRRGRKIPLSC